jgi:L-aspartate oxidase
MPAPGLKRTDLLVVGSGVAGLSAALAAAGPATDAEGCQVVVLTPGTLGSDGATCMAQGGVAAAVDPRDDPDAHAADTARAGEGLGDPERIRILTHEASGRITDLVDWGARFDRASDGTLALGLEGAHGHRRILHANGDQTGRELARVLRARVRSHPRIHVVEGVRVRALRARASGPAGPTQVTGVTAEGADGLPVAIEAPVTLLATGGAGRLYRWTTNPPWASGDGIALAIEAGAWLAGMEFMQFHPTALHVSMDPLPLVSEAIRGEGARLVDATGRPLFGAE